ncbi:hypothetical protein I3760_09G225400 [Carya illinoinensis]|nr:hypothetical protein I3760_09G225400 [Carya illinoinensis]
MRPQQLWSMYLHVEYMGHNNCGVCIFHVKSSLCRIYRATTTVEYVFTRRIYGATTTVEYVFFMLIQVSEQVYAKSSFKSSSCQVKFSSCFNLSYVNYAMLYANYALITYEYDYAFMLLLSSMHH